MPTPSYFTSLTVPREAGSARKASAFLLETARHRQIANVADPLFEVAITEAITNAIKHGGGDRPDATIRCELEIVDDTLIVRVVDSGPGCAVPPAAASPSESGPAESLSESGYGFSIIQAVFPVVEGRIREDGFCLELKLKLKPASV